MRRMSIPNDSIFLFIQKCERILPFFPCSCETREQHNVKEVHHFQSSRTHYHGHVRISTGHQCQCRGSGQMMCIKDVGVQFSTLESNRLHLSNCTTLLSQSRMNQSRMDVSNAICNGAETLMQQPTDCHWYKSPHPISLVTAVRWRNGTSRKTFYSSFKGSTALHSFDSVRGRPKHLAAFVDPYQSRDSLVQLQEMLPRVFSQYRE